MELRSPDPSLNPYIAFAMVIAAGLEGIENKLPLPPAVDTDLYTADRSITKNLAQLPSSLDESIRLAKDSFFVKSVLGEELLTKYLEIKEEEAIAFIAAKDNAGFYRDRYFSVI